MGHTGSMEVDDAFSPYGHFFCHREISKAFNIKFVMIFCKFYYYPSLTSLHSYMFSGLMEYGVFHSKFHGVKIQE